MAGRLGFGRSDDQFSFDIAFSCAVVCLWGNLNGILSVYAAEEIVIHNISFVFEQSLKNVRSIEADDIVYRSRTLQCRILLSLTIIRNKRSKHRNVFPFAHYRSQKETLLEGRMYNFYFNIENQTSTAAPYFPPLIPYCLLLSTHYLYSLFVLTFCSAPQSQS
jgi:hypothetical protein